MPRIVQKSHALAAPLSSVPPFDRRCCRLGGRIAAGGLLALAVACQPVYENRGILPDPELVSKVVPGKSTKADVTRLMGSPSTVGTFDPNTWYYINRQANRVAFYDPDLISQKIYVVEFDPQGTVIDLQTRDNDAHPVDMIARATPAPGRELTFLEQLIGNFGASNKSKKPDKDKDKDQ